MCINGYDNWKLSNPWDDQHIDEEECMADSEESEEELEVLETIFKTPYSREL